MMSGGFRILPKAELDYTSGWGPLVIGQTLALIGRPTDLSWELKEPNLPDVKKRSPALYFLALRAAEFDIAVFPFESRKREEVSFVL